MKDEKDYDTLMFILNLTFHDWLNLFTGKQNFKDLADIIMFIEVQLISI